MLKNTDSRDRRGGFMTVQTIVKDDLLFPFAMLQYWFKPLAEAEGCAHTCPCGNRATYAGENYIDVLKVQSLLARGMDFDQATDTIWSEAVAAQSTGKY